MDNINAHIQKKKNTVNQHEADIQWGIHWRSKHLQSLPGVQG